MSARTRVTVLGGGPGALSAALELTSTPELRERYEVTVRQLGWRLGGKGASGRNAAAGQRIEEHGLHIWFGFYDNAFRAMQTAYAELGRPADAPLATWRDAFKPLDQCVQYERFDDDWVPHHFDMPANPLEPGSPADIQLWDMVRGSTRFLEGEWKRLLGENTPAGQTAAAAPQPSVEGQHGEHVLGWVRHAIGRFERVAAHHLIEAMRKMAEHHSSQRHKATETELELRAVAWSARQLREFMADHVMPRHQADRGVRMLFMWIDIGATMLTGILEDGLIVKGFGEVDDEEFTDWLHRHGATELTTQGSPLVRAVYDAAFCFERGDTSCRNVAAGKAAQDFIRSLFLYKGALMFKMQAGMGDVVFGPLYQVLRGRGVRFEFFNCVTRLGVGADGVSVDAIDYIPQATVSGDEYQPLVDVRGLPSWPSEPDWNQLEEGERLRELGVNLEQDVNPLGKDAVTLRRGEDFDIAVLGIPVGALPPICQELAAANHEFGDMLAKSSTVMTQAFQLWLKKTAPELGFDYGEGMLASCFVEPVDTYCDMNQLLVREDWKESDEVRHIAYFCGVLPDEDVSTQEEADFRAKLAALNFLRNDATTLWPNAKAADGGFDWDLLAGAGDAKGEARFDSQYWRGNFSGTERYALSTADGLSFRLRPDQSGFDNLFLAGDWTRNGIDGGSVEAAVTSGVLAARAISGDPTPVPGVNGVLESDRGEVVV